LKFIKINEKIIETFHTRIQDIPEKLTHVRPQNGSWTLKEILGHLIDSAANNHQRFVRLQEGNLDGFPSYNNENWIRIQNYNDVQWTDLVNLWYAYNKLLLHIGAAIDRTSMKNEWVHDGESHTLEWLIHDYFRHLQWHIEKFNSKAPS
jgi:hypothetical protein